MDRGWSENEVKRGEKQEAEACPFYSRLECDRRRNDLASGVIEYPACWHHARRYRSHAVQKQHLLVDRSSSLSSR